MTPEKTQYTYLFQTCGFRVVDDIRAEIESQSEWDFSKSAEDARTASHRAARRFGFFEPFTKEQSALSDMLIELRAGPMIATYAWGLYSDCLAETVDPEDQLHYA